MEGRRGDALPRSACELEPRRRGWRSVGSTRAVLRSVRRRGPRRARRARKSTRLSVRPNTATESTTRRRRQTWLEMRAQASQPSPPRRAAGRPAAARVATRRARGVRGRRQITANDGAEQLADADPLHLAGRGGPAIGTPTTTIELRSPEGGAGVAAAPRGSRLRRPDGPVQQVPTRDSATAGPTGARVGRSAEGRGSMNFRPTRRAHAGGRALSVAAGASCPGRLARVAPPRDGPGTRPARGPRTVRNGACRSAQREPPQTRHRQASGGRCRC